MPLNLAHLLYIDQPLANFAQTLKSRDIVLSPRRRRHSTESPSRSRLHSRCIHPSSSRPWSSSPSVPTNHRACSLACNATRPMCQVSSSYSLLLPCHCLCVMHCISCHHVHCICIHVHLDEYIISSHCIIFIWAHLDAWYAVGRGLCDDYVRSVSANGLLSFFPWLMCACYDPELYRCFVKCHAIFIGVYAMYFCDLCGD